jgi:hypothetical protein
VTLRYINRPEILKLKGIMLNSEPGIKSSPFELNFFRLETYPLTHRIPETTTLISRKEFPFYADSCNQYAIAAKNYLKLCEPVE